MIHNPSTPPPTGGPTPSGSEHVKKKEGIKYEGKGKPVQWGSMHFTADEWKKFMNQLANNVVQQIKHDEERRKKKIQELKEQNPDN